MLKAKLITLLLTILIFTIAYVSAENQAIFQQSIGGGITVAVKLYPYKPPELPSDLNLTISVLFYNGTYEESKPKLEHVTFSIWIKDDKNSLIKEFRSIHSHEGNFTFAFKFPSKGKYILEVQLERIGMHGMGEEHHATPSFSKASFELFIGMSPTSGIDITAWIVLPLIIIAIVGVFLLLRKRRTKAPS